MSYRMDAESVILQTVFGDHAANRCWFLMNWALLRESGAVALETVVEQTQAVITAVALKRILAEFYNRMTECGNDIGSMDVISALDELGIGEEPIWFLSGQGSLEGFASRKRSDTPFRAVIMVNYVQLQSGLLSPAFAV